MKEEEKNLYLYYLKKMGNFSCKPLTQRGAAKDLFEKFDVFFFDAFGTLYNRGGFVYPGAKAFIQKLRETGKEIRLITNAAHDEQELSEDLLKMGFLIYPHEIYSSGNFLKELVQKYSIQSAYFLGRESGKILLERSGVLIEENPQKPVVIICSTEFDSLRLRHAEEILKQSGSLLIVLNPDACAPEIDGSRSDVSGLQAYRLMNETHCAVECNGKPFPEVFERALKSVPQKSRVVMVGDTLGTDIVGASKVGISSCLVMGRNMREESFKDDCQVLGFTPDYIISGFE